MGKQINCSTLVCSYNEIVLNNSKKERKEKELLIHMTTWMNLTIIMPSERSQKKKKRERKNIYCVFPFIETARNVI